jgi:hypothetical protein
MKILFGVGLIQFLMLGSSLPGQMPSWPVPQSVHETHTFAGLANGLDTPVSLFIKDSVGLPIYKLVCHSGNYDDDSEYNFSGTFQCALFAVRGEKPTSGNLLAADTKDEKSTDWWNRGRMRAAQLIGECLAFPEYGTIRHFKLRGMVIVFQFENLEWSKPPDHQSDPIISKFTFKLDVAPAKSARSSVAEVPKGPKPPSSCYP